MQYEISKGGSTVEKKNAFTMNMTGMCMCRMCMSTRMPFSNVLLSC